MITIEIALKIDIVSVMDTHHRDCLIDYFPVALAKQLDLSAVIVMGNIAPHCFPSQ